MEASMAIPESLFFNVLLTIVRQTQFLNVFWIS